VGQSLENDEAGVS